MAYAALMNGQIEALAVAKGNADALIATTEDQTDDTKKGAYAGFDFFVEEKYKNNVVLLNKEDAELLAAVNEALAKAMEANLYDGWYEACQIYAEVKTADELGYDDEGNKITE
jgi:ABC-type amino acid transport substrate-binding protein